MRTAPTILGVALALALLTPVKGQEAKGPSKKTIEEYCERAVKLRPLDVEGHLTLARWCTQNGLGRHAKSYLERVVALDPGHVAARRALGYVRRGTGWVRGKAAGSPSPDTRRNEEIGDSDEQSSELEIEISDADIDGVESDIEVAVDDVEMKEDDATADTSTDDLETSVEELDAELAAKKEWIAAVEERMQQKFLTHEDEDFLIHTTLPSLRHAKVLQLRAHLKDSKKRILQFLGIRSPKGALWPGKVQLLLVRSEQQFDQFAELVDDVDVARGNDGAYSKEGHTVVHNPQSFDVLRHLAEVAVDQLHDRQRLYSWWIIEGTAEHIVNLARMTKGASTRDKQRFYQRFRQVADLISAKDNPASIFDLLESRELKRREEDRGRAMAMTLVDFLYRTRRKGYVSLLEELKGAEAPAMPAEEDEDGWKTYWLSYFAYQEKVLTKHFRKDVEALDGLWKRHVLTNAKKYQGDQGNENQRQNRGRNARPGTNR